MSDQATHASRPGTLGSFLSRLGALIRVRTELFSIEAQEQKEAMVSTMLVALLSMSLLLLALFAALIFITLITPPALRITVIGSLSLGLFLAAGFSLRHLFKRLNNQPRPFSLTLTEVQKDLNALLRKDNQ